MRSLPRFLLSCSLMSVAASLPAQQLPPGSITSITTDVAVIGTTSPPETVTVTVAADPGQPLSSLDGLLAEIGKFLVPVKNGKASAQFSYAYVGRTRYIPIAFPIPGR